MSLTIEQYAKGQSIPPAYAENAKLTVAITNEVFAAFPPNYFRFTSGGRSAEKNAAVNGETDSFHLQYLASDFMPNNGQFPYSDAEKIGSIVKKYGWEVIKHNAGSGLHYHIEPSPTWTGNNQKPQSNSNSILPILLLFAVIFVITD